jgi:hypothetical protein
MGSCSSSSGGLKQDGKGGLLLLPSMHLLPLAFGGVWGMDSLMGEPLSNYSKSSTDLLLGALYSDVALPKRGANPLLDREGSYPGTKYVSDLLEAAYLSSNDVTCTGIRNDAGLANCLEDNVPGGRSWVRGNVKGTASDVTIAMH